LAEVSWDIFDSLGFIVGINYDIRWQQKSKAWTIESQTNTDYTQLYSKKAHIYSAYLQGRYMIKNFLEGMILTAGVRSDNGYHAGKTYYNLSPRFALVQKLTKEINIKAMYGSALKAPGQDAYSHNEEKAALVATDNGNGIIYSLDENLNPEVIHTNELAVTFDAEKISISVSGFYNITKDMLVKEKRVDAATTDIYFNKSGTVTALGGEFEIQAIPIKNLRLIGNYSYARVRDQDDKKIENTPSMKTNVITSYTAESLANLTAAVIVKWVKDYNTNSSTSTYHGGGVFLDMNVLLPLPYGLNLQFQALNIIGTKNTAPDGLTPMPGRTFNIGIHGKF
ncbi:MAG: TonB-dependent receptor, partial [bacterium]|nr:TonB-dependent receptor [bacterium]